MDQLTISNIPPGIKFQRVMDMARLAGLGCGVSGPTVQTDTSSILYQNPTWGGQRLTNAQFPELVRLAEILHIECESSSQHSEAEEVAMGFRLTFVIKHPPLARLPQFERNNPIHPLPSKIEHLDLAVMVQYEAM